MKSIPSRCVKRSKDDSLTRWARSVVAAPAAHHATPREAAIVGSLLAEMRASNA